MKLNLIVLTWAAMFLFATELALGKNIDLDLSNESEINDATATGSSFFEDMEKRNLRRSKQNSKRTKTLQHNGFFIDTSIESYKSLRLCHASEVCKSKYRTQFECVCGKSSLCVSQGSLFDAKCGKALQPYIWIQGVDENVLKAFKTQRSQPQQQASSSLI